jgi:uncharacterized protein YdeI (YjbR/CyaY-like superfamily)
MTPIFYPSTKAKWREWLQNNHTTFESVWVVFYNKSSNLPTITWSDAVDEALCFGWIDRKKIKIDSETSHQFFSKRKAKSTWSKINKIKVEQLIANNKFTKAGFASIEIAQQNESWSILDKVEELIMPDDLIKEFKGKKDALGYYENLSKSSKKMILQWIVLAKQAETRQNRIAEIVACAMLQKKPKGIV